MKRTFTLAAILICLGAPRALAATFVVPADEELISKADAIVTGVVEGSYVQEVGGTIETVHEIRVDSGLKGAAARRGELIRVTAMGGAIGLRGVLVPGEAVYRQGERVLVFLTRDERGRWRTTDLTLGRFEFVTSTAGERVLVRDMEHVVGWDHAGRPHREQVRREEGFLRFIRERVRGGQPAQDYVVDASAVTLPPDETEEQATASASATTYPASTYTSWVNNQPVRWPNISGGVNYYKRSDQNIAGAADGGVSVIQNGLNAWTNECGSLINMTYGGQIARASANHDSTNVVEFNDPQGRISGSWGGSGTVGIGFLSFAGTHSFNGATWLSITDGDVVFQDGYTAANASFPTAMTHELGHTLGWRHSNQNHATGGGCSSSVEECTTAAIMNSAVNPGYGYTLQPFDVNAAQSVYPGGTCGTPCTAPSITSHPASATVAAGSSTTLSVSASGTGPLSYQWYVGTSGNTGTPVSGGTGSSLTVAPGSTTNYWVRVTNACGSANSSTATVTVSTAGVLPNGRFTETISNANWRSVGMADFNADGRADVLFQNTATGQLHLWYMNATTVLGSTNLVSANPEWRVAGLGDMSGDGRPDIVFNNVNSGQNVIWVMNGTTFVQQATLPSSGPDWRMVGLGDFTRDGRPDILFQNRSSGTMVVWVMSGLSFVSQSFVSHAASGSWQAVATADLSGDGYADIVFRNSSNGQNVVWYMNGMTFSQQFSLPTVGDVNWRIAGIGDVTGDGSVDLLWQNAATLQNAFWYMRGITVL